MPVVPEHIEYAIISGHIAIALEDGRTIPAYWAHPNIGSVFPSIVLIHDWWGITAVERRLANAFAQAGYYVIVPDMFNGQIASTPQEAMLLVERVGDGSGYALINTALQVLETHHRSNRDVAAVGLGFGGSLAFEAAVTRDDLEAAVAYYGFPQRYLERIKAAKAPIMALYGSGEPHVKPDVRDRLRLAMNASGLAHELIVIDGAGRDFFADETNPVAQDYAAVAIQRTIQFLDKFLKRQKRAANRKVY